MANRRQFERMLKREADKRKNEIPAVYIDSYGSCTALMVAPMLYNIFFLDYESEGTNSYEIAMALRETGCTAPIYICISEADTIEPYDSDNLSNMIFRIHKPLLVDQVSCCITNVLEIMHQKQPLLEFRGIKSTIYLKEEELSYVKRTSHELELHRANGDIDYITSNHREAFHSLENHDSFIPAGKDYLLNMHSIETVTAFSVIMKNGETISITPIQSSALKKYLSIQ